MTVPRYSTPRGSQSRRARPTAIRGGGSFFMRAHVRMGVRGRAYLISPTFQALVTFGKGEKSHLTKRGKSGIIKGTEKHLLWSEDAEYLEKGEHLGTGLQTESPQRLQRHNQTSSDAFETVLFSSLQTRPFQP